MTENNTYFKQKGVTIFIKLYVLDDITQLYLIKPSPNSYSVKQVYKLLLSLKFTQNLATKQKIFITTFSSFFSL